MTEVQDRAPSPVQGRAPRPANKTKETSWGAPLIWGIIGLVIVGGIWLGWSPLKQGSSPILYDNAKNPGWISRMLFQPTTLGQKLLVMVVAIALFLAIMGLILWLIDRPKIPTGVVLAGFLGPVVIFLSIGLLWSGIKTVIQSFQKFDDAGAANGFVGLDNYAKVFTGQNTQVLINSVLWIFLVPLFAVAFGLLYAVLVDRTRFEAVAKSLIFLPTAISMVASGIIWRYVYLAPAPSGKDQIGLANALVHLVGGTPQNWITKAPLGTFALIIVMVWIQTGFAMTVLSAALKAVPDDIIEAARIDGATGPRLFFSVMLPSIRPTVVVVLTTVAIASLKTFDIVNVMGGNLPKNNILANAFYNALVVRQNGLAGAFAVVIFIIVTPVIIFNVRQMKKAEENR
ncbi:sugar ABC transporter permease [Nakamurella sp. A5-74]|uniref:Sugar ABC transporter permease n=1 Tax=Nakamurella sp. A5-74 TaxID=3158264 RepID=A0AAU8DUK6_9ACTN